MKNTENIENQVAQLTTEQQNKILKVGKMAVALQLVVLIPWMILCVVGIFTLIDPPATLSWEDYDKVFYGLMTLLVLGAAYVVGIFLFVKIKYPYYSDAKYRYIQKTRRSGSQ